MKTKIIHYCWFGNNDKSELIKKCIESWHKFAPNFEIREWNEDNFDIHCCKYVEEAYSRKKWAFVSDYCRFYILNSYGGVYLDTDVELIKSINDLPDNFVAFENPSYVNSGLIRAARTGDTICKLMLESYHNDRFILKNGDLNLVTVCVRETAILKKLGLKCNNTLQVVADTTAYPTDYFCPLDYLTNKIKITENTHSIHHYAATWYSQKEDFAKAYRLKLAKVLPTRIADLVSAFWAIMKYDGFFKALEKLRKKFSNKT